MDFDWPVRLKWISPAESIEVRFGTSRAGAVDVALYITASVDTLAARTNADWEQLCSVEKGRHYPLMALTKRAAMA